MKKIVLIIILSTLLYVLFTFFVFRSEVADINEPVNVEMEQDQKVVDENTVSRTPQLDSKIIHRDISELPENQKDSVVNELPAVDAKSYEGSTLLFDSKQEADNFLISTYEDGKSINSSNFDLFDRANLTNIMDLLDTEITSDGANHRDRFEIALLSSDLSSRYNMDRIACSNSYCVTTLTVYEVNDLQSLGNDIPRIIGEAGSKSIYPRITERNGNSAHVAIMFSTNDELSGISRNIR